MDLSFGSEYEAFRQEVREFIEKNRHLAPVGAVGLRSEKRLSWQKLLIENGYTARTIPREYGGYGAEPDILKSRIIAEEFARAQVQPGLGGQGIAYLVPMLLEIEDLRVHYGKAEALKGVSLSVDEGEVVSIVADFPVEPIAVAPAGCQYMIFSF